MVPIGFSPVDIATTIKVLCNLIQNAKRACGAYHEVLKEANSLEMVLGNLSEESEEPDSLLQRETSTHRREYNLLIRRCAEDLSEFNGLLEEYNTLGQKEPSLRQGVQKFKFGNGKMLDLEKMRIRINAHKTMTVMFLQNLTVRSLGRIEKKMNKDIELKSLVMWIFARVEANGRGQSDWTSCGAEEKTWWRTFRRQLINKKIPYQRVDRRKDSIIGLLEELGNKGVLDEPVETEGHVGGLKHTGGMTTSGRFNEVTSTPGTDNLGSLLLKIESEDFRSSFGYFPGCVEDGTTVEDHGQSGITWPMKLLERMENPIDFGELYAILGRFGVPEEHQGQWMKLFSRVASNIFPNGGLIVQEHQYDWDIWSAQNSSMGEWVRGKYMPYSTELEVFRQGCSENLCPPLAKMELVPCSFGACVRAYTPIVEIGEENTEELKTLLTRCELVKVSGIDHVFRWELHSDSE